MSSSHNSDLNDNIGAGSEGSQNNHNHVQLTSATVDDESDADFVTAADDISVGDAHDSVSDDDFVTAPDIPADIPADIGVIHSAASGMQVDDQNDTAAEPLLRDYHIHNADQNIARVQEHINAEEEDEVILPVPQEEFDEQFVDAAEPAPEYGMVPNGLGGHVAVRVLAPGDLDYAGFIHNEESDTESTVSEFSADDVGDDEETVRDINYDQSAPAAHRYLGGDMQDVTGRVIYDDDSTVCIPAYLQRGVILIPGQTMPIQVYQPSVVAMMRNVVEQQKTIAVLHYKPLGLDSYDSDDEDVHTSQRRDRLSSLMRELAVIGTTAEVLSMSNESDDEAIALPTVKAITRGRQRFKLLELSTQSVGILTAKIKILAENRPTDSLQGVIPRSHYRPRVKLLSHVSDICPVSATKVKRLHNDCSNLTHWPRWVHSQYSEDMLMYRIRSEVKLWGDKTYRAVDNMTSSEQMAYWLAENIPMTDKDKLQILSLHSPIQRLRYELHLIQRYTGLACRMCNSPIAQKTDIFSLSYEGPMGTYVNPHGAVHETLTVYKAKYLSLIGTASTQYSWFPGYAWTIVNCRVCGHHKGWRFTATNSALQPVSFYGLTRNGLIPGIRRDPNNLTESDTQRRRRLPIVI